MTPRQRLEPARQSVVGLILLTALTLGVYPAYWFYKRAPFFDAIRKGSPTNPIFPMVACALAAGDALFELFTIKSRSIDHDVPLLLLFARLVLILIIRIMAFDGRATLLNYASRIHRPRTISGLLTFFVPSFYLQHVINRMLKEIELDARERRAT